MNENRKVNWCSHCNIPIINENECPLCGNKTKYLTTDLRPVFPEERLLIEVILNKPFEFLKSSVWASKRRFYINGISLNIPNSTYKEVNTDKIINNYTNLTNNNNYNYFNRNIELFILANKNRFYYIKKEATQFIKDVSDKYKCKNKYISFSGGKDSTVISDLVTNALNKEKIPNIFCDTTLELSYTYDYINSIDKLLYTAKNSDNNFYNMCNIIGPPSRNMRWCCTMFKTGPIARLTSSKFKGNVISFLGIRSSESTIRSKYQRVNESDSHSKIQGHISASPILYWKDIDVWLYILIQKINFNKAYRLGYSRVGCYCCPNNTNRDQFLASVFMPELSKKWRNQLLDFAFKTNKQTPYEYVDGGFWKARQGGRGLKAANNIKIDTQTCTIEENAKIYKLNKPISEHFWELFTPLGNVSTKGGRKILNEVIVCNTTNNYPVVSLVPFSKTNYSSAIKVKVFPGNNVNEIYRKIGYQVRKYNACQSCLKCESICNSNAITILNQNYRINNQKCTHCQKCVMNKYLSSGCLMYRYLFDSDRIKS